jgi:hypothetical protein
MLQDQPRHALTNGGQAGTTVLYCTCSKPSHAKVECFNRGQVQVQAISTKRLGSRMRGREKAGRRGLPLVELDYCGGAFATFCRSRPGIDGERRARQ